jgi:nucleoside-diphosphate-sugar epimerase
MKIAVLGSNGFLGNYICQNLKHDVIPINRCNLNLNDFESVKQWLIDVSPDVIVNCATSGGKASLGETNYQDIQNNLSVFLNFFNNSQYVRKFINIGSGAEFDIDNNINQVKEAEILNVLPKDSYGYSKNIISRILLEKNNFYTLRLFGCFDKSEPDFRLFKKFLASSDFCLSDRQFDYISAEDFLLILDYFIVNNPKVRDINCVYPNKLYLSEILDKFNKEFKILKTDLKNYTGNGDRLLSLNIPLKGLDYGIKKYKE